VDFKTIVFSWRARAHRGVFACLAAHLSWMALLPIVGCGETSEPRHAISGTVRVDSVDAVSGSISFLPVAGTMGPAAATAIVDGKYKFTVRSGPFVGEHRVVVGIVPREPSGLPLDSNPSNRPGMEAAKRGPTGSRRANTRSGSSGQPQHWETRYTVGDNDGDRKDFDFVSQSP
jgi:hypothetical protein